MREAARKIVIFAPRHTKLGPQFTPLDSLCHLIFFNCISVVCFVLLYLLLECDSKDRMPSGLLRSVGFYLISFENVEAKSENL